jgi:hypothetical protein
MGVPQHGCLTMQNPTKMDDLGVPPFQETSIYWILDIILDHNGYIYILSIFWGLYWISIIWLYIYIHIVYLCRLLINIIGYHF